MNSNKHNSAVHSVTSTVYLYNWNWAETHTSFTELISPPGNAELIQVAIYHQVYTSSYGHTHGMYQLKVQAADL